MRSLTALAALLLPSMAAGQNAGGLTPPWDPDCVSIVVPPIVSFRGVQYDEIPDVVSPDMRLANVLLSSGCTDEARSLVETLLAAEPNNPDGLYVFARLVWVTAGTGAAEELLQRILAAYPGFVSAHVLLAGVRISQHRFDEATKILNEVEPVAGNDIWVYLDRLRIEVATAPNDGVRETLLAVLATPAFPPNVRITAANALHRAKDVTEEQFEATFRIPLDIKGGLSLDCKLSNYAMFLTEGQGRFEDARELLEAYQVDDGECRPLLRPRARATGREAKARRRTWARRTTATGSRRT